MACLLELEHVSVVYNKGQDGECIGLDNLDLEIEKGDYITIWGGNGAGKSSLLNAIARDSVTNGRVYFSGEDITAMPEHKRAQFIGRVTQNPFDMLAESLTLEENLAVACLRGKKRSIFSRGVNSKLREKIRERLASLGLGLEDRLQENAYHLSGGERQAVTLLMATIDLPDILLLDEHTAALDIEKTRRIENLTDSIIRRQQLTTLWITHKKEQAARFGDRILFLRQGKIVKDLRKEEKEKMSEDKLIDLLEQFQHESTFWEDSEMALRVRKDLLEIPPYDPGKPIEEVQREYGLTDIIKLASNENPLGPSPRVIKAIQNNAARVGEFPDEPTSLKAEIASRLNLDENQVILGNGSDEIISRFIIPSFSKEGDEILMGKPPFARYYLGSRALGRKAIQIPLKNYVHDLEAMANAITEKTKIIFIGNPHNPTGTMVTQAEVDAFMRKVPEDIIVAFDEAYYEYVTADDFPDSLDFVKQGRNVIVLRTFSKAYAIAGLRIGYGLTKTEFVEQMEEYSLPWHINTMAQIAASVALQDEAHLKKSIQNNEEGKRYLYEQFESLEISYVPTSANFILVDLKTDGRDVYEKLLEKGVIVRPMEGYGLPTCIRVTIGKPEENRKFIAALTQVLF